MYSSSFLQAIPPPKFTIYHYCTNVWEALGPSQICECPLREPRVFDIAHIYIYIYTYNYTYIYIYVCDIVHCKSIHICEGMNDGCRWWILGQLITPCRVPHKCHGTGKYRMFWVARNVSNQTPFIDDFPFIGWCSHPFLDDFPMEKPPFF